MAFYKIEDLTFTYPNCASPALSNVSFEAREGDFLLLIGRSGCGKSTLLRHMKTSLAPHGNMTGRVLINGRPLGETSERDQAMKIGFVFQHPDDQIVTDKVWHELAFGLESIGADTKTMRIKIAEMASYFGLDEVFYKNVSELSGGQKQLLNLASVMALSPEVLIMDEPTSQLDPIAASEFLSTVKKLNTELGITVIISEHRLEEAMPLADRVLVLDEGRLVCEGKPRQVAGKLCRSNSPLAGAMPTAARIFCGIGAEGLPALTVNEGRRLLNSLGLEKKLLPSAERKARDEAPAIKAEGLMFRYEKDGDDVLKGLDVSLHSGEIYGLVGGNGAGKSTLLKLLSGAAVPYRGRLTVGAEKLKGRFSAFEKRIGCLYQDPRTLFSKDTVWEDLESAAFNRDPATAKARIDEAVRLMDIESCLSKHPFDLSGGEQQRAAAAKVLLTEPNILLLDEPTKGMDASIKEVFGEKLRKLAEKGIAILLVSHDIEFCAEYADTVGFMFDGRIDSENAAREFFCENVFYTTAANRIARDVYKNALLEKEVTALALGGER
ncbi:MAG: ATP-binding cassette domain-containing protein [Clostridiales bacterium]|nr:ATP-binding cassette domain-containing protein [Clostridiales bacterium]